MRETISGPQAIPAHRLGSVARALTFAEATPAPPRNPPPHLHPSSATPDPAAAAAAPAAKPEPLLPHEDKLPHPSPSAIRVVLRVRPLSEQERKRSPTSSVTRHPRNDCTVHIRPANPKKHPVAVRNAGHATFKFAHIFDHASSQSHVFEETTLPMIEGLFNAQSAVVFAHGVTCSGKTWTIQGSDDHPGILPRSLDVIVNSIAVAKGDGLLQESTVSDSVAQLTSGRHEFGTRRTRLRSVKTNAKSKIHDSNYIEVNGRMDYKIFASYLEVYNEQCYDLFEKSSSSEYASNREELQNMEEETDRGAEVSAAQTTAKRARRKILKLKLNHDREVHPEGITEIEIRNCADIDRLLEFGQQNRSVAHTKANQVSSRSHAVFFITLKMTETVKGPNGHPRTKHRTSKLSIVDLAGSERTGRTNNDGESVRQKETCKINSSLMNLGRCLQVMRRNQRAQKTNPTHKLEIVPFRHSRLTHLLQNCLEAGSAVMIANVSPTMIDSDETIQALRCAAIAQEVKLAPSRKKSVLKDRTNELNQPYIQPPSSKKIRGSTRKVASRKLRSNDALKENINLVTIPRAEYDEYIEMKSAFPAMKRENTFTRMEIEEEKCNSLESERRLAQALTEMDQLFRDKERLIDRLADSEARLCVVEAEVREEMAEGTEQLLKQLHDAYEEQLNELRREKDELGNTDENFNMEGYRRVSRIHIEGKEQAKAMAARIARRASKAAFDSVRFPLAECDQDTEDEEDEVSLGVVKYEAEEYVEADDVDDYIEESD